MSLPTIEELKRQCYIDGDHDNDLLLQFLSAAGYQKLSGSLTESFPLEKPDKDDPDTLFLSADIALRLKQMVGFWYENREGQSLPDSLYRHLRDYRRRP
ncbi:head-tail connector protein [Morganella morganii]